MIISSRFIFYVQPIITCFCPQTKLYKNRLCVLLCVLLCIVWRVRSTTPSLKNSAILTSLTFTSLTGLLFTAAKVRLWQSSTASAEWFRCSSVTAQLLTGIVQETSRRKSKSLPIRDKTVSEGRKINCYCSGIQFWGKTKRKGRYILSALPPPPMWLEFKVTLPPENLWHPRGNKEVV